MLSAIADRLGFWKKNVAWGNWENFGQYARQLTFFLPEAISRFAAYAATFLEIALYVMVNRENISGWPL